MLLGSGFVWGEDPQNHLMCTLVLLSDHIDFYINYDLEACAYRSRRDEKYITFFFLEVILFSKKFRVMFYTHFVIFYF